MNADVRVPRDGRQLLLSYYGDDYSGSTDVMEVLELAGIPTILYLRPPTKADIVADPSIRAVGLAGVSRAMSPARMDSELPELFAALGSLGAATFHYKLCSTFDSAPEVGNLGHAFDLARSHFGSAPIPLVVGSPPLGRYTVFGQLFARSGGRTYRLDRHPTLPLHPVTPMREADLLRHLALQSDLPADAIDALALDLPEVALADRFRDLSADGNAVILFDVLTMHHMLQIGRLIWSSQNAPMPLLAGSSGVETALVEYWRDREWLDEAEPLPPAGERRTALLLSGSCSEATRAQLDHCESAGYTLTRLSPDATRRRVVIEEAAGEAAAALSAGRSAAVFTARGPGDCEEPELSGPLGDALAEVAARVLERERPGRLIVAGGDTSGRVARRLGIDALRVLAPIATGSPLCRARSAHQHVDGLEIALKGGQVGGPGYVEQVRRGAA